MLQTPDEDFREAEQKKKIDSGHIQLLVHIFGPDSELYRL